MEKNILTIHRNRNYSILISIQGILLVGWLILQI